MPAVEYKHSAQVSNLTRTEEDKIMNTFMEGESYLVFANASPTCNLWVERKKSCSLGRGYVVFSLHLGFENGDIRLTSQVFDSPISGSSQRTNYPLDRAGCARGRYCTVANKKSCLHLDQCGLRPPDMDKAKMGQHFRLIVSLSSEIKRRRSLLSGFANK